MSITDRIQHAWNAFRSDSVKTQDFTEYGYSMGTPTHRQRKYTDSAFASSIFNRIAMDVSMTSIQHVKIDEKTEDAEIVKSGLHNCLNNEANIDQTSIQFMQDLVYSMFDEGVIAVVPVDTDVGPTETGTRFTINTMRVGKITQWYPQHVRVNLYNDAKGQFEEVTVAKVNTAIIENPLYAVINGPNATLSRLLRKMSILDGLEEDSASGKLDLFIQLPYAVKTELQRKQAEERLASLEAQLTKSRRGIAYTDATEKITQLNRPITTSLPDDIQYLTAQFYNQLGLTENVFNGTASESELRSYYTRTIDPIVDNIISEFNRKFLTKTARTQGHTLEGYRDPFKLVPTEQLAQVADLTRRNSVLTGNEVRTKLFRIRRSNDPRADELFNPNIADTRQNTAGAGSLTSPDESRSPNQNG